MNAQKITVAVVSMTTTNDRANNIKQAESLVHEAANAGAGWIVLPEMFVYQGPYDTLYDRAEESRGDAWKKFSGLARDLGVVIFAGSFAEKPEIPGLRKVYNVAYVFGRDGKELVRYRKIHLFNLKSPDGKPIYCESDGYLSGDNIVSFQVDGMTIGMAICYDLRFHELFAAMTKNRPVDAFVLPSAFTQRTGMDHWEVLIRARAIEHQAYFIASNQTGEHSPGKVSYGHSMIVDPWGHKLCDTGDRPGLAFSNITREVVDRCRNLLPALADRRPDLYFRKD
jgi:predicted amidohydrolase